MGPEDWRNVRIRACTLETSTVGERSLLERLAPEPERALARAYHLALRVTGEPGLAEDAVQDACTRLLVNPPEKIKNAAPTSYFLRAVYWSAGSLRRGERARQAREEGYAMTRDRGAATPAATAGTREIASAARGALASLPDEMRAAVALCCEQGLTQREAAAIMDVPEGTVARRVQRGLERLRKMLAASGFAALAPAMLGKALGALGLPSAPAGLAASIKGLSAVSAAGAASTVKVSAGATASAIAKGGVAMKVVAGIVAAGALAGAVVVSASMGNGGEPAPVNPYKGMQTREEVFEFTTKPAVKKEGDKWVITFASKGKCDATVAILDKDGAVIRHLASGVLGANAPHPFQQNSLSQKIEWDGLTDTFKKANTAGCKVRVSLGLAPEFERNIGSDLYETCSSDKGRQLILGTTAEGNTAIINTNRFGDYGRVYDKDGKYLRTFFPPPAEKLEEFMSSLGYKFATTEWGDKTIMANWFGPFTGVQGDARKKPFLGKHADPIAAAKALEGVKEVKLGERPANLQAGKYPWPKDKRKPNTISAIHVKVPRMVVDRTREEIYTYAGRFDGKTGELDPAWVGKRGIEMAVGFDGLVYLRMGGHGSGGIVRVKRDGTIVPFSKGIQVVPPKKAYWQFVSTEIRHKNPDMKFLAHGGLGQSQTWQCGMDVGPNGDILVVLSSKNAADMEEYARAAAQWLDCRKWQGAKPNLMGMFLTVYNTDGEIVTRRAVEGATYGSGAFLDRDGSIYVNQGGVLPPDHNKLPVSIKELPKFSGLRLWGSARGSLLKFRGQGGAWPVGKLFAEKSVSRQIPPAKGTPGADAMKVAGYRTAADGALWIYGAAPGSAGKTCACDHNRFDLDDWARSWIPLNQLNSVMVLDANGNRIMRIGRYGNIDDADETCGKIHFAWIRTTAASDTALYVVDSGNRRILKAALKYAAEEELPLP